MKLFILSMLTVSTCMAAQPAPNAALQEIAMTKCSRDEADENGCMPMMEQDDEDEVPAKKEPAKKEPEKCVIDKSRKSAARHVIDGD